MKQNSLLFYFTQHLPYFLLYRPRPDAAPVEFSPCSLFRGKSPCRIFNKKGKDRQVSLQGSAERCCHLEYNKVSIDILESLSR